MYVLHLPLISAIAIEYNKRFLASHIKLNENQANVGDGLQDEKISWEADLRPSIGVIPMGTCQCTLGVEWREEGGMEQLVKKYISENL